MTDALVEQIKEALAALAMPGPQQLERVRAQGVGFDELALEFDDVASARRKLLADGVLSQEQGDAVAEVHRQLCAITAAGNLRWTEEAALTGYDWSEVRRLAGLALRALG